MNKGTTTQNMPSLLIVQIFAGLALYALIEHVANCASSAWAWNTWAQFVIYVAFLAHYLIDDFTHGDSSRFSMHPFALMVLFAGWTCFTLACMSFGVRTSLSGVLTCVSLACFTGLLLREYAEHQAPHLARSALENLLFLMTTIEVLVSGILPETQSTLSGILCLVTLSFMGLCLWWRCHEARKGKV